MDSILPITAICAIALFLLKEALEVLRRSGERRRKLAAFKRVIARECELNHWAVEKLAGHLQNMRELHRLDDEEYVKWNDDIEFEIFRHVSGELSIKHTGPESHWGQSPLPRVRLDVMSELLIDVAPVNERLYGVLERGHDHLVQIEHVRSSLIEAIERDDHTHTGGLIVYGLGEIDDARPELDLLYQECTGRKLEKARVR